MDDKTPEGSTGALWSERARATLFACPDVVEGAVPINPSSVIEYLAGAVINLLLPQYSESLAADIP